MAQCRVIPITTEGLELSGQLYKQCPDWKATEEVLSRLAQFFPLKSDNLFSIMAKAASLNLLYGTYLTAIQPVAKHIHEHYSQLCAGISPEFVDDPLCRVQMGSRLYRLTSFTSKFCHFFVEESKFPMYDELAAVALVRHLGLPPNKRWVGEYSEYKRQIDRLVGVSNITVGYAELDRYLWLTGQWVARSESRQGQVNPEVRALFDRISQPGEENKKFSKVFGMLTLKDGSS